jgi:hypothetical protein
MGITFGGLIMALVDSTLENALNAIDAQAEAAATTTPMTHQQYNALVAAAISTFIKTATVTTPMGVAVQVTPATGTGATTAPGVGVVS